MKNRLGNIVKWGLIYTFVFVICLELLLRILGWGTFYIDDYSIKAEPKNAYIGHEQLGIKLNGGQYSITLNDSINFVTTHTEDNYRFIPGNDLVENPSLALLGCSFTYGYGVNDKENFAALLQEKFPEQTIRNSGVIGYGTVQSLIQLREMIKSEDLETVLLNFSSFHFMRNGLSHTYRANLKMGYQRSSNEVESLMQYSKFPYITNGDLEVKYQPWETMYTLWPGREWSATVNMMQLLSDRRKDSRIDEVAIAEGIIREMASICKSRGINFGIVCLDSTEETNTLKQRLIDLNWLDVGFDFMDPSLTNLPYDSHPSKAGHQYIGDKITPFLAELLNGK